jgi:hypothetical protein
MRKLLFSKNIKISEFTRDYLLEVNLINLLLDNILGIKLTK